ncbi:MAG: hypothetical protein HYU55_01650 [Nocardioides sp.]|nr:hypothetical protein [Nocardioides sp.]
MTRPNHGLGPETIASLLADTSPYLSCDDPALEAHLRGCGACAEEAEALLDLLAADAG